MSDLRVVVFFSTRGGSWGSSRIPKNSEKIFREKVPGMIGTSMFGTLRLKVFKSQTLRIPYYSSIKGWLVFRVFWVILQKKFPGKSKKKKCLGKKKVTRNLPAISYEPFIPKTMNLLSPISMNLLSPKKPSDSNPSLVTNLSKWPSDSRAIRAIFGVCEEVNLHH